MGLKQVIFGGPADTAGAENGPAVEALRSAHAAAVTARDNATDERALAAAEAEERRTRLALNAALEAATRAKAAQADEVRLAREAAERAALAEAEDLLMAMSRHGRSLEVLDGKLGVVQTRLADRVGPQRAYALVGQYRPPFLPLFRCWREYHVQNNGALARGDGWGGPAA